MMSIAGALFTKTVKARWCLALGALLVLLRIPPAWADRPNGVLKPMDLEVGFTKYAFLNVNRNDAEASFKAFLQTVGRQRGYDLTAKVTVFDDAPAFEAAVKSGSIDLVIIDAWRYLAMDIHKLVTPFFVTSDRGRFGKKYVLLTRQGSNLKALPDLRGKTLLQIEVTNTNLGRPWLETLLLESRLGAPETFFGKVEGVGKPSAAVLPVFFGNKDACLVDEPGFEIMKELNPQVGKGVQVMIASELLTDALICLRSSSWSSEKFKRDVIQILGELHNEPSGQQILTLFKVGQLVPFQDTYLDTVRNLRMRHEKLRKGNDR
jgi:ABC-type phosphate/phosphonate transport system substrate-binding protein